MDLLNALKKLVPILACHRYIGTSVHGINLYRYALYRYCCYGILCSGFAPVRPVLVDANLENALLTQMSTLTRV